MRTIVHLVVLPVGGKCEPWAITKDVMSPSGYVRRLLLNKEIFKLWYFPGDLWIHMNKEQLGLIWRSLSLCSPGRTLQVIEAVIKSKS